MAVYKKKKRRGLLSAPSKGHKTQKSREYNDIDMSRDAKKENKKSDSSIRVIKGKKLERQRRLKVILISAAAVIIAVLLLEAALPAGIKDTAVTAVSLLGAGDYPIDIDDGNILNVKSAGLYYYVLTDTGISAYSNSGKRLFEYSHGYENPVLVTAACRCAVFEQGGKEMLIFNSSGFKRRVTTDKEILTCTIGDSGAYALATLSDKYASAVSVYSPNGGNLYEWYSAEQTVNAIALSSSGKKLAVSVFGASAGHLSSKLSIFKFDSATPVFSKDYDNSLIYGIDNSFRNGIFVISKNTVSHFNWSNYKATDYSSEYNAVFSGSAQGGFFAIFNRESDETDNKIAVFSNSGKLKYEYNYNGIITDADMYGGKLFVIGNTDLSIIGSDGKAVKSTQCGFTPVGVAATGSDSAAVVTNEQIENINLEKFKEEKK